MSEDFGKYCEFVARLRELSLGQPREKHSVWVSACESAVDGEAEHYLAKLVSIKSRRSAGAFFTPTVLAERLATRLGPLDRTRRIVDPAMGAGNLLLAAARRCGRARCVEETVERWTAHFWGVDDKWEFVDSSRLRLWLLAHLLHASRPERLPEDAEFAAIRHSNLLQTPEVFSGASDVLLNPPFSRIPAPEWYSCGSGKINAAAIMALFAVQHMRAGARLHAILPEVLRSGSHYAKWRASIGRWCVARNVVSCGLFDTADVDVFVATFEKRKVARVRSQGWPAQTSASASTVADKFAVSVGPVVDFRDARKGPLCAYIHPRNVPAWTEVYRINERRNYSGRLLRPPFVVLRRTSRPGDPWRAAASIVHGRRAVAVENHFIVCEPTTGTIASCRQLLRRLKTTAVNAFLNSEMRCRHLTTGIVGRIPLSD